MQRCDSVTCVALGKMAVSQLDHKSEGKLSILDIEKAAMSFGYGCFANGYVERLKTQDPRPKTQDPRPKTKWEVSLKL